MGIQEKIIAREEVAEAYAKLIIAQGPFIKDEDEYVLRLNELTETFIAGVEWLNENKEYSW